MTTLSYVKETHRNTNLYHISRDKVRLHFKQGDRDGSCDMQT